MTVNKDKIIELETAIIEARENYYNNQPTVSDTTFDLWIDELKSLKPSSKAITAIGAPIKSTEWPKAKHQIPLGSLDKVQTPEELKKWITDTFKPTNSIFVTEKLDGISIELVYENGELIAAITRGDGNIGEDITANVVRMGGVKKTLPTKFSGSLRGEIILKKSKFEKYFPDKSNPRNTASGVSKRLDGIGCEHLDVFFYQAVGDTDVFSEQLQFKFLEDDLGLNTPNYEANSDKDITKFVNDKWNYYQNGFRSELDYDIDGLVVRVNDLDAQVALGEKDLRPKGAVAYKFRSEEAQTTIVNIVCQVGNSGRLTPVAEVKPVQLAGAQVSRASLYNFSYINELGLDIGTEVIICRSNDVIPRINSVVKSTGTSFKLPPACPACGGMIELQGENLICINTDICPAQKIGRIKNWINAINILEWGDALIQRLVESNKVNTISDLYKLTVEDLISIERMGEKSAKKCYDLLWANNKLPLEIFVGGLSISMIGPSMIKLVMNAGHDSFNKLLTASKNELATIKGMGPAKSDALYNGLKRNKDLMYELIQLGVVVKDKIKGNLSGKSFVFTGKMAHKRQDLEQLVVNNGGEVKSQVGKTVNFLVIDDVNSTTSKATNAKKFGTTLISEDQFLKMVEC